VFVISIDDIECACAQFETRLALPGVAEPPDVAEFGRLGVARDKPECPAGVGRAELCVVADEQQLRAGRVRLSSEGGEFPTPGGLSNRWCR